VNDDGENLIFLIESRNFIIIIFILLSNRIKKNNNEKKTKKKLYFETGKQDISSLSTLASSACHKFVLKLNQ